MIRSMALGLLFLLFAAPALHAESTSYRSLTGKVLGFDMKKVRILDALGQIWEVPRDAFEPDTNWGAIHLVTVRVFKWHLRRAEALKQPHHR